MVWDMRSVPPDIWAFSPCGGGAKALMVADEMLYGVGLSPGIWGFSEQDWVMCPIQGLPMRGRGVQDRYRYAPFLVGVGPVSDGGRCGPGS